MVEFLAKMKFVVVKDSAIVGNVSAILHRYVLFTMCLLSCIFAAYKQPVCL